MAAMSATDGDITQASKALGVHRNTLHNKLRSQTMLNGFAENMQSSRPRLSAKRVRSARRKSSRANDKALDDLLAMFVDPYRKVG